MQLVPASRGSLAKLSQWFLTRNYHDILMETLSLSSHSTTTHFSVLVVDHDVVWLDISVHDAHTMAIVECLQQLIEVEPNVVVCQSLVQLLQVKREGDREVTHTHTHTHTH